MEMVVLAEEINLATLRGNAKVQRNIERKENGNNETKSKSSNHGIKTMRKRE